MLRFRYSVQLTLCSLITLGISCNRPLSKTEIIKKRITYYEIALMDGKGDYYVKLEGRSEPKHFKDFAEFDAYEGSLGDEEFIQIIRDSQNRVRFVDIMPHSESGDWYYEIIHGFAETGEIEYFRRSFNAFNDCDFGRKDYLTEYFEKGNSLGVERVLTDINGKPADPEKCKDTYQFNTSKFKNAESFLKKYRLK